MLEAGVGELERAHLIRCWVLLCATRNAEAQTSEGARAVKRREKREIHENTLKIRSASAF